MRGGGRGLVAKLAIFVASVLLNAALLIVVASLSQHVLPPRAEAREEHHFVPPAPMPRKQLRERRPRPEPKTQAGPEALDLPALDLPSQIQAPELLASALNTKELVRSKAVQEHALGSRADLVLSEELLDEPPRVLVRTPPRYPYDAQEEGVEGFVVLKILVDRRGEVREVFVLQCEPQGVFDDAAADAVRSWRFQPPTFRGEPVQAWVRQRITFSLD